MQSNTSGGILERTAKHMGSDKRPGTSLVAGEEGVSMKERVGRGQVSV